MGQSVHGPFFGFWQIFGQILHCSENAMVHGEVFADLAVRYELGCFFPFGAAWKVAA